MKLEEFFLARIEEDFINQTRKDYEAKRQLLDQYAVLNLAIRVLAKSYSAHPDYDDSWAV
jgi:hypothetical protein